MTLKIFDIIFLIALFFALGLAIKFYFEDFYVKMTKDLKKFEGNLERNCFSVTEQGRKLCDKLEDDLNLLKDKILKDGENE